VQRISNESTTVSTQHTRIIVKCGTWHPRFTEKSVHLVFYLNGTHSLDTADKVLFINTSAPQGHPPRPHAVSHLPKVSSLQ